MLQFLGRYLNKGSVEHEKDPTCCSAGMSTSMLVKKMQQAAESKGIECKIDALSVNAFEEAIQEYDVCLLGPQVRFQLKSYAKRPMNMAKTLQLSLLKLTA